MGLEEVLVLEDDGTGTVGYDLPLIHDNDPWAELVDEIQIMGGDNSRQRNSGQEGDETASRTRV